MLGYSEVQSNINRYYDFLKKDYGYKGPFEWNIAYEKEYTYVNQNYYLNIGYDGGFFFSVGRTKQLIPELSTGEITFEDIDYKKRESRELFQLLSKQEKNILKEIKNPIEQLSFFAEIVKANSEILQGDWYRFSIRYKLWRNIRSKILGIIKK